MAKCQKNICMLYENHISETILNAFVLPPPPPPQKKKKLCSLKKGFYKFQYSCIPHLDKIFFLVI